MQSERFRHNRDESGTPRATLATLQRNDVIYFGIARCNPKDTFTKKLGRMISRNRALKIFENHPDPACNDLTITATTLGGTCPVDQVRDLLDYFRSL